MLVKKEIIRPGTYWYQDQVTGVPRKLTVTPRGIKHFHDSGKKMRAAGLSIPVPVEHQPEARPLTPAEKAAQQLRDNAGWTEDFEIKDVVEKDETGKDVVVKDVLFGILDIQDKDILEKLPRTIRYSSPWINSFVDGNGNKWEGVISHLALTSRPRITKQQPFSSVAAAMSFSGSMTSDVFDDKPLTGDICLSKAGLLKIRDLFVEPQYPVAFSLWAGAKLASEEIPEEKKPEKKMEEKPPMKGEPKGEPKGEMKPEGGEGQVPEKGMEVLGELEEALVDGDGDISVYEVICDLLESEGYTIPEGTDATNFAERMYTILMDKMKSKGNPEAEMDLNKPSSNQPPQPPKNDLRPNPIIQEQPPMYMSLEKIEALEDPNLKNLAKIAFSLQQNALETAQAKRMERIERLCRRVNKPDFRDKLIAQAGSIQMSLGIDGKVNDPMAVTLEMLESGIRETPQLLMTSSAQLSELQHPREYNAVMSEERRQEVVNEFVKNSGLAKTAK